MELSIISPTYNESENIDALVSELESVLDGIEYEIIIADDDSPDLTWKRAEEIGQHDFRVRSIRRMANHGLGPAVVDGFMAARGEYVACLDADLQHDPRVLPKLLRCLREGAELAVASRYVEGGGTEGWNWSRRVASWVATRMARWLSGARLCDPMSGFFMMRRAVFLRIRKQLDPAGFKILLEIVAALRTRSVAEVGYVFRPRKAGKSKLSRKVVYQYLRQLWRLSPVGRALLQKM